MSINRSAVLCLALNDKFIVNCLFTCKYNMFEPVVAPRGNLKKEKLFSKRIKVLENKIKKYMKP